MQITNVGSNIIKDERILQNFKEKSEKNYFKETVVFVK